MYIYIGTLYKSTISASPTGNIYHLFQYSVFIRRVNFILDMPQCDYNDGF